MTEKTCVVCGKPKENTVGVLFNGDWYHRKCFFEEAEKARAIRQQEYDEIEKGYKEKVAEKIICGKCGYKYSKYLNACPKCAEMRANG